MLVLKRGKIIQFQIELYLSGSDRATRPGPARVPAVFSWPGPARSRQKFFAGTRAIQFNSNRDDLSNEILPIAEIWLVFHVLLPPLMI